MEQLVARQAHNLEVARSNPASATKMPEKPCIDGAFFISEATELGQYSDSNVMDVEPVGESAGYSPTKKWLYQKIFFARLV